MDSQRPLHVALTGDLSGDYVVVEERPDGSLLLAPDTAKRLRPAARRPAANAGGTLFSGLLSRPAPSPRTAPETLEDWGVELGEDEIVREFLVGDIDGRMGFLAITSQRFIFVADAGGRLGVVQEHLLSAARDVEVVRRRRKQKLRVSWHGAECLIGVPDQDSLSRLERHLTGQRTS